MLTDFFVFASTLLNGTLERVLRRLYGENKGGAIGEGDDGITVKVLLIADGEDVAEDDGVDAGNGCGEKLSGNGDDGGVEDGEADEVVETGDADEDLEADVVRLEEEIILG